MIFHESWHHSEETFVFRVNSLPGHKRSSKCPVCLLRSFSCSVLEETLSIIFVNFYLSTLDQEAAQTLLRWGCSASLGVFVLFAINCCMDLLFFRVKLSLHMRLHYARATSRHSSISHCFCGPGTMGAAGHAAVSKAEVA